MALTKKRRAFVEEYLIDRNATQAAIRAGYSERTAYSQGSRLLKNVEVLAYIEQRQDELTMSASEALYRLNQHAIGDMGQFIGLSEEELIKHPQSQLIKKYKMKRVTRTDQNGEVEVEDTIQLELYDSQSAIKEILKTRRLDSGQATENTQIILRTGMDLDEL
jgi:phage terminase small subunit